MDELTCRAQESTHKLLHYSFIQLFLRFRVFTLFLNPICTTLLHNHSHTMYYVCVYMCEIFALVFYSLSSCCNTII